MMETTKFLFLMGGSGCGKTTLAKNLEKFNPMKYYRCRELSTRAIRDGEVDGYDYIFVTEDEFKNYLNNDDLFEHVIYQFPDKYGCDISQISELHINVVVVSIEGFLTSMKNLKKFYPESKCVLVNITNDCELDISREGRDPLMEERVNKSVLMNLNMIDVKNTQYGVKGKFLNKDWPEDVAYQELKLSKLKEFRNSEEKCLEYFNGLFK